MMKTVRAYKIVVHQKKIKSSAVHRFDQVKRETLEAEMLALMRVNVRISFQACELYKITYLLY